MEYVIIIAAVVFVAIILLQERGFFSGNPGYICDYCDIMVMQEWVEEKKCRSCNKNMTQIKGYF